MAEQPASPEKPADRSLQIAAASGAEALLFIAHWLFMAALVGACCGIAWKTFVWCAF